MDTQKAALVICLTLLGVVLLNAAIYLALRRGDLPRQLEALRRITGRERPPWEKEQADLEELSRLVARLQEPRGEIEDRDD